MPRKINSGPVVKNIQSHLSLTYLNNDEHMHPDKRTGNTDILDMAFISPNLTKHDIEFVIGDDLGHDHLPIENFSFVCCAKTKSIMFSRTLKETANKHAICTTFVLSLCKIPRYNF